jgi:Sulfotransferase family
MTLGSRESHQAPFFVLAPPRSGSTVVTMMLGEHPELCAFPELHLFEAEWIGDALRRRPDMPAALHHYNRSGVLRALAQVHEHVQTDETITRASRWLEERRDWRCEMVFDYLLDTVAPLIGTENTPETASNAASLQRALGAYPQARLIHLVRHPVSTIRSIARLWSGQRGNGSSLYTWSASVWLSTHARLLDIGRILGSEQMVRVRAEDVINRPDPTLRGLARCLNISTADDALESMAHPENSVYASVGPRLAPGGGDASFFESPHLRRIDENDSLALPAEWNLNKNVVSGIMTLAEELGYGSDRRTELI